MCLYLFSNLNGTFGYDVFFRHRSIPECLYPDGIKEGDTELHNIAQWTNFVNAEKDLWQLVQALDKEKIITATSTNQAIEWKFNRLAAPHVGTKPGLRAQSKR